ncbi:Transmembrane osmosensor [Myotisia sp. PD_48]|nr:Transmembrane osmosensor [Myotisia sp. PD_48]
MARLQMSNIVGDPFALATVSISSLAWVIAFVSSIVVDIQTSFPNYFWWAIAYELCCIVGVAVVMASDTAHIYGTAVVGYAAAGLGFASFTVDALFDDDKFASKQSAGAGLLLLSMINVIWIFYFGSTPQSRPRSYIDSFAPHKEANYRHSKPMSSNFVPRPETTLSGSQPPQLYTSAQLNGLETSSPMPSYTASGAGGVPSMQPPPTNVAAGPNQSNEVSQPTEYPYRAKAIYSYEANPDDANEISFAKHEILEVSDVSGRWWQAKKSTGDTGIAPSNYLILL